MPECEEVIEQIKQEIKELGMKWEDLRTYRPRPYSRLMALSNGYEYLTLKDYCEGKGEIDVQNYVKKWVKSCEGNVIVYRGGVQDEIDPGDWVALDRKVAEWYVEDNEKAKLLIKSVPIEDVRWAGSDISEWYYLPARLKGCINDEVIESIKKEIG